MRWRRRLSTSATSMRGETADVAMPAAFWMSSSVHSLGGDARTRCICPRVSTLTTSGWRMLRVTAPEKAGIATQEASKLGVTLNRGVYVAWTGPALETRAEYRMLRGFGGDVVGMSTVPEVIVARHAGMRVLGLCIITDECLPDALEPVDVPRIIGTAMKAQPDLTRVVERVVGQL